MVRTSHVMETRCSKERAMVWAGRLAATPFLQLILHTRMLQSSITADHKRSMVPLNGLGRVLASRGYSRGTVDINICPEQPPKSPCTSRVHG